ncbi:uncharacterized protein LOC110822436 [Carica papaya]|uniref:uncharacterized protein LOC110822436 n=1 Tax=Carica papaya TaxID=3649 RepID=UPI000B8CA5E1|nr:uncharacterized protein LOC110822436 [Carica papaya]
MLTVEETEGKYEGDVKSGSREVDEEEEEEEEEEALSLCDLPVNLIEEDGNFKKSVHEEETRGVETGEDFDFGSWVGSISAEQAEMCAADEVFFKGQILPLRHSVSSDKGLFEFHRNPSRCVSRSQSMDHCLSAGPFTSSATSRSSSCRSHYSSSSSSASSTNNNARNSNPRIRNQFIITHPSPKPQLRTSIARNGNPVSARIQKFSMWDFFRLGLVRAPEIELRTAGGTTNNINRGSVSRNNSWSSSNSNSSVKNSNRTSQGEFRIEKQRGPSFMEKRKALFNGCKCSVSAVETVPLNNIVIIKSCKGDQVKKQSNDRIIAVMEEKLQELKIKKKSKEKQEGKQALSRHRTFEWLKELPHAGYVDHEA